MLGIFGDLTKTPKHFIIRRFMLMNVFGSAFLITIMFATAPFGVAMGMLGAVVPMQLFCFFCMLAKLKEREKQLAEEANQNTDQAQDGVTININGADVDSDIQVGIPVPVRARRHNYISIFIFELHFSKRITDSRFTMQQFS